MSTAPGPGYRFLSGAEMDPQAIGTAYPGARFIARARLQPAADETAAGEVWGILIRLAGPAEADLAVRQVTTDDGRTFPAAVAGDGRPTGEPDAILAAARYWELPPAYVKTLLVRLEPV